MNGYQKKGGEVALQKAAATPSKYEQHYPGIPNQHTEDIFPGIIHVNFQIYRQRTSMSCIAVVLKCSMVSEHNLGPR